jgi:transcription elongation factor GreA
MDVKEKEEYNISTDATNRLENIESEVVKISDILQRADVIPDNKWHSSIELGSTVFLESEFKTINYTLVNSIEADPSANKISEDSPLGRALIGKTQHSTVSIVTPRGKKYSYRVQAVK